MPFINSFSPLIPEHYLCTFERRTCSIAHRAVQAWCRSTLVTREVRYARPDYIEFMHN